MRHGTDLDELRYREADMINKQKIISMRRNLRLKDLAKKPINLLKLRNNMVRLERELDIAREAFRSASTRINKGK